MRNGRKSGPMQTILNSVRPWAKTWRPTKFHQSIAKIATNSKKDRRIDKLKYIFIE